MLVKFNPFLEAQESSAKQHHKHAECDTMDDRSLCAYNQLCNAHNIMSVTDSTRRVLVRTSDRGSFPMKGDCLIERLLLVLQISGSVSRGWPRRRPGLPGEALL